MRRSLACIVLIVLAGDAALTAAAADCTCRARGQEFELGQSVCLATAERRAHRDLRHGAEQHLVAVHRDALRGLAMRPAAAPAGHAARASPPRRVSHTARRCTGGLLTRSNDARHRSGRGGLHAQPLRDHIAGILALICCATPAAAASWFELNFGLSGPRYDALVPLCDDRACWARSARRFAHKEGEFWNSNLEIVGIDRVREAGVPPLGTRRRSRAGSAAASRASPTAAPRRALFDPRDLRLARRRWGVEWCVVGLDRNWAYNPSCRMARP